MRPITLALKTFVLAAALSLSAPGAASAGEVARLSATAATPSSPAVREGPGQVLVIAADTSASTATTDPDGVLNSAVPAAAYASHTARTYVATFNGEAGEPQEVEGADEAAVTRLAEELASVPRQGATDTAGAVDSCLDRLEVLRAQPGSACLVVTDARPEPDGPAQLTHIEEELAPRAADNGYELAFLGLGRNDPAGAEAFQRVSEMTGAPAYRAVADPARLAEALLLLIAEWRPATAEVKHLDLQAGGRVSTTIEVGARVRRLDMIATRGSAGTEVSLLPPQGSAAAVRQLTLERVLVYAVEAPASGAYLLVARGPEADAVSLVALREGGLGATLSSDPSALPAGETGVVRVTLEDDGARYPADGARATVSLSSASGDRFTSDGWPSAGGGYLDASFPPMPEGSYAVEAVVYLPGGGSRTVRGRGEVVTFPDLELEAPECLVHGRPNRIEVRSLVDGRPATIADPVGHIVSDAREFPLKAEGPGTFSADLRPGDSAVASVSAQVAGSYRGSPTVRLAPPLEIPVCPAAPLLTERLLSLAADTWPAMLGAVLFLTYISWWLTRPSPWSLVRRDWYGAIATSGGYTPIAALEHRGRTLPIRVFFPHVVPPSTVASIPGLGSSLEASGMAIWLYERWDGLGCVVGRRVGPIVLPVKALVIAEGGYVEIWSGGVALGYEREEVRPAVWR